MLQLYNNFNDNTDDNNKWGEIYFNQFSELYCFSQRSQENLWKMVQVISVKK